MKLTLGYSEFECSNVGTRVRYVHWYAAGTYLSLIEKKYQIVGHCRIDWHPKFGQRQYVDHKFIFKPRIKQMQHDGINAFKIVENDGELNEAAADLYDNRTPIRFCITKIRDRKTIVGNRNGKLVANLTDPQTKPLVKLSIILSPKIRYHTDCHLYVYSDGTAHYERRPKTSFLRPISFCAEDAQKIYVAVAECVRDFAKQYLL